MAGHTFAIGAWLLMVCIRHERGGYRAWRRQRWLEQLQRHSSMGLVALVTVWASIDIVQWSLDFHIWFVVWFEFGWIWGVLGILGLDESGRRWGYRVLRFFGVGRGWSWLGFNLNGSVLHYKCVPWA